MQTIVNFFKQCCTAQSAEELKQHEMNLATPQKRPHFNGEVVTPNTEDRQDYMIDKLKTNRFTLTTEKWHDEDDLDTQDLFHNL